MHEDSCAETLPWQMVETLAQAIAARVGRLPERLPRVAHYAREIAVRLGWEESRLGALQMASFLHDIGELAAPSWSLARPPDGRPAQWKGHVLTGAAMLEGLGCHPETVATVRSHHEYWDGSGYPDGLRGEAIPAGARILAVAHCLAVLPLPEALEALRRGAGAAFDPGIAALILRQYREIADGSAAANCPAGAWLEPFASAARKDTFLDGLIGELGNSLDLAETLGELDGRLRKLIGYDSLAVWTPRESYLAAAYVSGPDARWLCSLEIPLGRGGSGRAAETGRVIWNGDPAEEGAGMSLLRSMAAMPVEHGGELAAVLSLYRREARAFSEDEREVLLRIRKKLAAAVANALKFESLEKLSTEDAITSLPNERALFLRLDAELARCRRNRGALAVLVCDVEAHRLRRRSGALRAMASGLRRLSREEDCVARMGDRFVLVLGSFAKQHLAEKRKQIEALIAKLNPEADGGRPVAVKVAAAFYPDDGTYAEDLLAVAEARMPAAVRCQIEESNPG